MLRVSEIFESLQGEGSLSGTPALFVRFAGCNLACSWCDTDHRERETYSAESLLMRVEASKAPLVCLTGGEPSLQEDLPNFLAQKKFINKRFQAETNGTLLKERPFLFRGKDLVTISPKQQFRDEGAEAIWRGAEVQYHWCQIELKLIVWDERFAIPWIDWFRWRFPGENIFLQPKSCEKESTETCVKIVKMYASPNLRLGLQMHKILGLR